MSSQLVFQDPRQLGLPTSFWKRHLAKRPGSDSARVKAFNAIVRDVGQATPVELFSATKEGVPSLLVELIESAFRWPQNFVTSVIGVAPTTYTRKRDAGEDLPEVVGQRVVSILRLEATLKRLLEESGDPDALKHFDVNHWFSQWLLEPQPEIHGMQPAHLLWNQDGVRALELLLERMRGGLPA